ncbi:MAG TPA: hypothetical protein VL443_12105 [Cyclobacteriaceae bacterium]|nr:hypothetical protein [Cyclobacteriaceae bacterium]
MRVFLLICFLSVLSIHCYAQQNQQGDKLFLLQKSEKYRRMQSRGTLLTVLGGALVIGGIVTLSNATITQTPYGTKTTGNPEAGALAFLLGVGGLGAGIPLWIIGAHNHHKYDRRLESLYVGFNATPQRTGLTLRYRF